MPANRPFMIMKASDAEAPYDTLAMLKALIKRLTPWLAIARIFFVPIAILTLLAVAFLRLPMGRDVVVASNQLEWSMLIANTATLLMAYALWYLPRLLAYTHDGLLRQHPRLRRHLPRFFAASCFNIMLLAQLHSGAYGWSVGSNAALGLLLLAGPAWYYALHKIAQWIRSLPRRRQERLFFNGTLIVVLGGIALSSVTTQAIGLIPLVAAQLGFQVLVECHRDWSSATAMGSRAMA